VHPVDQAADNLSRAEPPRRREAPEKILGSPCDAGGARRAGIEPHGAAPSSRQATALSSRRGAGRRLCPGGADDAPRRRRYKSGPSLSSSISDPTSVSGSMQANAIWRIASSASATGSEPESRAWGQTVLQPECDSDKRVNRIRLEQGASIVWCSDWRS
jgi:hypothetical protein